MRARARRPGSRSVAVESASSAFGSSPSLAACSAMRIASDAATPPSVSPTMRRCASSAASAVSPTALGEAEARVEHDAARSPSATSVAAPLGRGLVFASRAARSRACRARGRAPARLDRARSTTRRASAARRSRSVACSTRPRMPRDAERVAARGVAERVADHLGARLEGLGVDARACAGVVRSGEPRLGARDALDGRRCRPGRALADVARLGGDLDRACRSRRRRPRACHIDEEQAAPGRIRS